MRKTWLNALGTEYQFALSMGLMMQVCWVVSAFPHCEKLHDTLEIIITALSSLALAAIGHGAYVRGKNPGSDKDLIGDTTPQ